MLFRIALLTLAVSLSGCGKASTGGMGGGNGGGTGGGDAGNPDAGKIDAGPGGGAGGGGGGSAGGQGGQGGGGQAGGQGGGSGGGAADAGTCTDGIKSPNETDIDCGAGCTARCAIGQSCLVPNDCSTPVCVLQRCVACNTPAQCPGADSACRIRTCMGNSCGVVTFDAGIAIGAQTAGDCHLTRCDADGGVEDGIDLTDLPLTDNNACTGEVCSIAGVPSHPALPADTACTQDGGAVCDGLGTCVPCNTAAHCPGSDTECRTRVCSSHLCAPIVADAGILLAVQAAECRQSLCDGDGGIATTVDDARLPVDDGNQCTGEVCTSGSAGHPFADAGIACNQDGGQKCDGQGSCDAPPDIALTVPGDGANPIASTAIAVTFTVAMDSTSLTAQTVAGSCSDSIQLSRDGFITCVAMSSSSPVMSNGAKTATFTPAPGLLVNNAYRLRITTAATSRALLPMAAQFTHPAGFLTLSPSLCSGELVISMLYGAGGNAGATYTHDFVELHNRGSSAVSLSGKSLQYASAAGTSWATVALTGSVPGGGYFLVQLATGGAVGVALPTANQLSPSINMAGAAGKIALMGITTASPTGACPPLASTIDFVGFGATATCFEGTAATAAPSTTTVAERNGAGCLDTNNNAGDFTITSATTAVPRTAASTPVICACVAQNESDGGLEADYCNVQFPLSLSLGVDAGSPPVFGQIFELGVTESAGAAAQVRAQLGVGPANSNPQYEPGWVWTNATFNVQAVNNDEYQAQLTAPSSPGSYRYVYRMSLDQGMSWTYCDQNLGDFGAGSNANLRFNLASMPVLTVTP